MQPLFLSDSECGNGVSLEIKSTQYTADTDCAGKLGDYGVTVSAAGLLIHNLADPNDKGRLSDCSAEILAMECTCAALEKLQATKYSYGRMHF